MTNFMVEDLAGSVLALIGFVPILICPGFLLGAATNLFGFRSQGVLQQIAWSVSLSFGLAPLFTTLGCRYFSLGFVATTFVACFGGVFVLVLGGAARWSLPRDKAFKWLTAFVALAVVVVLGTVIVIQVRGGLYLGVSAMDQSYRTAFVGSVVRSGVPPTNPLFHPGHNAPLRYYYFWYAVCAICVKLVHVSALQALMASSVWAGIGVVAVISLFVRHFLQVRQGLYTQILAGCLLLGVTGADLLPTIANFMTHQPFAGDMEWWSADQVSSWVDGVCWVPNHVAALVCCTTAFLLLWMGRKNEDVGTRIVIVLLAAVGAASAFGCSIYVAIGFAFLMAAWTGRVLIQDKDAQQAVTNALAAGLAGVFSLPFARDLLGRGAGATGTPVASVFQFGVRRMIDVGDIASLPLFGGWHRQHPRLLDETLRLLLLIPGYAVEFGFFGVVLVVLWRTRASLDEARKTAVFFSVVGLLLVSFVRSIAGSNNDFGYRAALLPSFFLLLLGSDVLLRLRSTACDAIRGSSRIILLGLLALGTAGTVFQVIALRLFVPIQVARGAKGFVGLPEATLATRENSAEVSAMTPLYAIVQANPIDETDFRQVGHLLFTERAMTTYATEDCGAVFGGERSACADTLLAVRSLYVSPSPSALMARSVCARLGIDYLVAAVSDPAWQNRSGWVWTLPLVSGASGSRETMRTVECGVRTSDPAAGEVR
jgi:hypothetical protein